MAKMLLPGVDPSTTHAQGRCGYGPRLPLLVISAYAKQNFVDHSITNQSSIIRFIEDNWLGGERIGQGSFDAVSNSIVDYVQFREGASVSRCFPQSEHRRSDPLSRA